jgi:hypothetical protein
MTIEAFAGGKKVKEYVYKGCGPSFWRRLNETDDRKKKYDLIDGD